MTERLVKAEVQVTSGMRGIFPVLVGFYMDEETGDKWIEPINTGFTCKTTTEAWEQAHEWAEAEGLVCVCPKCKPKE